jgi:hypothetical protein
MTTKQFRRPGFPTQAEGRLRLFEEEVSREPWKVDHDEAMRCMALEETLQFGVQLYDHLVKLDEATRATTLAASAPDAAECVKLIRNLFEWWLRPGVALEREIKRMRDRGFRVDSAEAFLTRKAEAEWALAPAEDLFRHPRFVKARDAAIDECRSAGASEVH